jgi:hypothetical protein
MEKNINTMQEESAPTALEKTAGSNEHGRNVREAFAQISPKYKKRILIIVVTAFIAMFFIKIVKRFVL